MTRQCVGYPAIICDDGCEGDHCALDDLVNAEFEERANQRPAGVMFLCGRREVQP